MVTKDESQFLKELLYSEIHMQKIALHELQTTEYALNIRSPNLFLKANLDGLKWYLEGLLNFDAASPTKYRERLLRTHGQQSYYSTDATVAFDCVLGANTLVLSEAKIGHKAHLREAVVSDRAVLADGVHIERTVVAKEAIIGTNSFIKDSSVGRACQIGDNCRIISSVIEQGANILPGSKIENETVSATGERKPYQAKAQFNKFILEDELEVSFEDEEDDVEQNIGILQLSRLRQGSGDDTSQRCGGRQLH